MEIQTTNTWPLKLYKFTSFEGAKAILKNQSIRFSSPILFNDPFDCQIKVKPEFKHGDLTEYMIEKVKTYLKNNLPIPDEASSFFRLMYRDLKLKVDLGLSLETKEILSEVSSRWKHLESHNYYEDPLLWTPKFRGMRIAAFSTTKQPIIMWSHYADHHRGICFEFNSSPIEGFLQTAQEVIYSEELPTFANAEQFGDFMLGLIDPIVINNIFRQYLLRKSPEWKYEAEWRSIIDQPVADELFTDRPFKNEELSGICFGVRTSEQNQQVIKSLCYKKYPVQFWNARRSDNAFSLEFEGTVPF